MQRPEVKAFFHEATNTFSYVVWDPAVMQAAILDAVLDYDAASGASATHRPMPWSRSCRPKRSRWRG